ncbi:MAG: hypothetical protein PHR14_00520 [Oscillospiraceae bacterium]|nr:hypothetical protein [Oscillospiraceae bacterium]
MGFSITADGGVLQPATDLNGNEAADKQFRFIRQMNTVYIDENPLK